MKTKTQTTILGLSYFIFLFFLTVFNLIILAGAYLYEIISTIFKEKNDIITKNYKVLKT